MTGKDLISRIVKSINIHSGLNNPDVVDAIDIDDNLSDSIIRLKALVLRPNVLSFLIAVEKFVNKAQISEGMGTGSFLSVFNTVTGIPEIIDFSIATLEKKNRSFSHITPEFSFFSTKMIFDNGGVIDLTESKFEILWTCIQDFCDTCYSNAGAGVEPALIINFFDCLQNGLTQTGFLVNKNFIPFIPEKHYAYIYLHYLNNSNTISLSSNLVYSIPQLNNSLTLDSTKVYEQYFDVYDVINELNQSSDILNRFLKLYHTLEYLVYRVYLVEMLGRLGINRIFIREFINASENMRTSEKVSFAKNFQTIFTPERAQITTDLSPYNNPVMIAELKSKNIVNGFPQNDLKQVANLIYGIRNGIVHNKEGEYHLTIANADDFSTLIPLIRQIIKTFENLVVFKLKENDISIRYSNREMNLY